METKTLTIPTLYGDHHTTAVKQILEGIDGVQDTFVTAAFRQVQITFDPAKVKAEAIVETLADQGYSEDAPALAYAQPLGERSTRHTAAHSGTGDTLSFGQYAPDFQGRPLWPCPGIEPVTMDE